MISECVMPRPAARTANPGLCASVLLCEGGMGGCGSFGIVGVADYEPVYQQVSLLIARFNSDGVYNTQHSRPDGDAGAEQSNIRVPFPQATSHFPKIQARYMCSQGYILAYTGLGQVPFAF